MDSINEEVSKKLLARAETGHLKYGVTMDRRDLSLVDWLQHLQEELLDAAVYVEKLMKISKSSEKETYEQSRQQRRSLQS